MSALIVFIQKAIAQGIGMLFGATGEIITEKSGNLNLGVPGLMYMGGIAGLMGAFIYESGAENPSGIVGVLISMLCALLASGFGALIYSVLTITLRADIHTHIVMSGYKGGVHELPFTAVCPEFRIVDVIPVIGITGYEVDMEAEMAVLPAV